MLKKEYITKPIQIIQYKGSDSILLVPDYVASVNTDISAAILPVHTNGIVLLTNQDNVEENGMYKYNGTSLDKYYFDFFKNTQKIYKVTKDSSYIVYNGPTDTFNQFYTIDSHDTLIIVQNNTANLPYEWYSYEHVLDPKIKFNPEILKNNFCALGIIYDDKTDDMILSLDGLPSKPIVLTSEVYNGVLGSNYHVVVDLIQAPDINYKNIDTYNLVEDEDFTIDEAGNLILDQNLISDGLNGTGKLKNWRILNAADPNFLNNYLFIISSSDNTSKAYYYNSSLDNPYNQLTQNLVRYPFSVDANSDNIVYEKKYLIQNNILTVAGLESPTFINSSFYAQQLGTYEIRVRLFDNSLSLLSEDRVSFHIKQTLNLPTPTPTPTPSSKKHTVVFDAGPILNIDDCEDCYKDFLSATVTNMSAESRYYYEFGVFAYGNANPDDPEDNTNLDDITFTTSSGVINNGLTTETIKTLMTTGIGKIRTTLYVKVINLDNYITSTAYITVEKCNRDFCAITPTPTPSKALKSYPPRTPTKTKTPTPTQTSTKTPTPTPTPTTPLLPPGAPQTISTVAGNASVLVSWTAPTNSIIRDYVIQYSSNSGSTWTTFNDGSHVLTSTTVTGLTNGTSYIFRVAATNGAGSGPYITTPSGTTPIANAPNAPTITSVVAGDTQVIINWTVPNNGGAVISDYVIDYSSNVGASWTTFDHPASTATSATITGLVNGLSYIFRVAAVNSSGTGQYSVYSQAATPATLPNTPTSVNAAISGSNINVSWFAPTITGGAAITDYAIQYSTNSGASWTTFADGTSTATNAVITGLSFGSTFIFRVAAINRVGTGNYSDNSSPLFYALAPSAPSSISTVSINNSIQVSWTVPASNGSSILDYTIQVSDNNGLSWTTISSTYTNNIITISSPDIVVGTAYLIRVAARNSIGLGAYVTSGSQTVYPQGQILAWGENTSSQLGDGLYDNRTVPEPLTKQWSKVKSFNTEFTNSNYTILAITTDGKLYGWGYNADGLNGDGTTNVSYTPKRIGNASNWVDIAIGESAAYAINSVGELYAWGSSSNNQLGTGGSTTYTPVKVGSATNWVKVVAGNTWAAAINSLGELYTWGYNLYGLGAGLTGYTTPTRIGTSLSWADLGAGYQHLIAISTDGQMWGCGLNNVGQVGDGTTINKSSLVRIGTLNNWVKVNCGYGHNLAINSLNQLFAWGANDYGQLGDGTNANKSTPIQVGSSSNWRSDAFDAGQYHSMAANSIGEIYSWGYNGYGQLGDGTSLTRYVTYRIATSTNISSLSVNRYSSWVINNNNLFVAGYSPYTGTGTFNYTLTSIGTSGSATIANNYTQIYGGSNYSIGINSIGEQYIWGNTSQTYANNVFIKTGLNYINTISASLSQKFYTSITTNGTLYVADDGASYAPNNLSSVLTSPVAVTSSGRPSLLTIKAASGFYHTLVIDNLGRLYGIGYNSNGAIGSSSLGNGANSTSWVQVGTASNWTEIDAGDYISAGINSLGELYTWGLNDKGQLGQGDTSTRFVPTRLGLLSNWVKVAVGKDFMLALNSLGEIWAWGNNVYGQLGIGSNSYTFIPFKVGTSTNWTAIAAGGAHSLALNSSKQLWVWGDNSKGQLGNNTVISSNVPIRVGATYNWLSISAGTNHSLGIIQT